MSIMPNVWLLLILSLFFLKPQHLHAQLTAMLTRYMIETFMITLMQFTAEFTDKIGLKACNLRQSQVRVKLSL